MMRQMRENTKWIMLATALAFVALMVFEWGMDITGMSAGGLGEIGRVNGTPVFYDDYLVVYRNLYDQIQANQNEPITSQQNREIEDMAFDDMVDRILITQELDRRGIQVTDREIQQAAQFSPPPVFQQLPIFLTDGAFDLQKYQAYISSPAADQQTLLYLEAYYRDVIPRGKLMRQISTGHYLTEAELWEQYRDEFEAVEIRYIPLNPVQRIADADVEITTREIQQYYDQHEDDFSVPPRAHVRVVVLDKTPTPADTAALIARAEEIRQEILDGADFQEIAQREAPEPAAAEFAGLPLVFAPGGMMQPLDSLAFAAPLNQVVGPELTQLGIHLLLVDQRWGQDSVSVRQIHLPVVRTDDSEIELLTLADSLEDMTEVRSLDEAANTLGLLVQETEITDQFNFVAGAGQILEGADWAFEDALPGDISPVFESSAAFYTLELVSSTPGGTLSLADASETIRNVLLIEKKIERARVDGQGLVDRIRGGNSLPDVAAEAGLEVRGAGPFTRVDFVPGIGQHNAAVGAAFGLGLGEVSDPVAASQNVFVIEQLRRIPADSTVWREQLTDQRSRIGGLLQQELVRLWLDGLRATARIQDRRDEVLQPATDDPLAQTGGFGF